MTIIPERLWLGTQFENNADRDAKRRHGFTQRTHCPAGHPYDEANTYLPPGGGRYCRACSRARAKAAYWRSKGVTP